MKTKDLKSANKKVTKEIDGLKQKVVIANEGIKKLEGEERRRNIVILCLRIELGNQEYQRKKWKDLWKGRITKSKNSKKTGRKNLLGKTKR